MRSERREADSETVTASDLGGEHNCGPKGMICSAVPYVSRWESG